MNIQSAVSKGKLVVFSSAEKADEPRVFFKVARSAAEAGYEVVLIARHSGSEVRNGVRIEPIRPARNRLARMAGSTWSAFVKAMRERADVYQFSDPELLPFGLLLQLMTRRPVIYDLREFHAERIREKFWLPRALRLPLAKAYELAERLAVRWLAGLSAVNADLASRGRPGRVAIVPNYPPRSVFGGESPGAMSLRGRYEGRRVVLFMGGISEDRGALVAVRAMSEVWAAVPEALLMFVGQIHNPAFEAELRGVAETLGLRDAVEIVGLVQHEAVPAYLALAEVGLCLLQPQTRRYALTEPIKFFEYAAAGVPQVVSDLPALRRLTERTGNGILVDSSDPGRVASAVVRLLQNREEACQMGERGRRAFTAEYNWDVAFGRLEALYQAVMRK